MREIRKNIDRNPISSYCRKNIDCEGFRCGMGVPVVFVCRLCTITRIAGIHETQQGSSGN
jgi:hypothetical protein